MKHDDEVEAWYQARVRRLTAKDGWLTIIGRHPLHLSRTRVGSDPTAEIPLPEGRAPRETTTLELVDGQVWVEGRKLGPPPDAFVHGPFRLEIVRQGEHLAVRVKDEESPRLRDFAGIPRFPVTAAWRKVARFEEYDPPRTVEVDTGSGIPDRFEALGLAHFEAGGASHSLEVYKDSSRPRLFVLFKDETNRTDTYGAGRFLYAPMPEKGEVVLDFNMAFNPPCAFAPYVVCPLPPPENRLKVRVEAGEKLPSTPSLRARS